MNLVAIALAKNEADIIGEGVTEALRWADAFVIYDNGSTDGTPDLAEEAGAMVIRGPEGEPFNEKLRQHTLDAARDMGADWLWRIDIDEIYHPDPDPRLTIEQAAAAGAACVRAMQAEFWLTIDDVRRGLLLEDESVSVQKRRRWYTIGHMAMVAWCDHPDLAYRDLEIQKRRNVPVTSDGLDVSRMGHAWREALLQKHYNCRSIQQVLRRMEERSSDYKTFGKYRYNLIIDETIGLYHLGPDEVFRLRDNHNVVYQWYKKSQQMFEERDL